jgi:mono/diheme cytochrome c family protein
MKILIPALMMIAGLSAADLRNDSKPVPQKPTEQKQPQRQLPWEKDRLQIGQALYRENCIVCHDIDVPYEKSIKQGPSFNQLFAKDAMPESGVSVEREYIRTLIRFGGGIMPAFQKKMTPAQMDLIIDFIASK